jgi:hypothetical protein
MVSLFFLSGREPIGIGFLKETNAFPSHRSHHLGRVDVLPRCGGYAGGTHKLIFLRGIQAQHERRNCLREKLDYKTKKVEREFFENGVCRC